MRYVAREFVGTSLTALIGFINKELSRIGGAFNEDRLIHIEPTAVAPAKPREGDVRLADGTNWNPGAGAGFYGYYGGAWNRLG